MALRNIVKEGDPILLKKCRPYEKFDKKLWDLLDDLVETLADSGGVGLAAPQVGVMRRACVIDVGDGPVEFVNPEIIETEGEQEVQEGCLSCPDQFGIIRYRCGIIHRHNGNNIIILIVIYNSLGNSCIL